MSTIANRLREIAKEASDVWTLLPGVLVAQRVSDKLSAIATELEAAPAADAVPVVAWLRMDGDGGSISTFSDTITDRVKSVWLGANPRQVERYTEPLVRQSDHLSAIAALQQKHEAQLQSFEKTADEWMRAAIKSRDEVAALQAQLRAVGEQYTALTEAMGYPSGKDSGQSPEEFAAALQARIAELEARQEWVSVADHLPPKNTEVLICFAGQNTLVSTGQWTGSIHDVNGWCYPHENRGGTDSGDDPVVTHWQYAPEVPTTQPLEGQ